MRPLLFCLLIAITCTITSTNGFLFKKKFVDGCNPNPCKHKAKCQTSGVKNQEFTCFCEKDEHGVAKYHGLTCKEKTGCYKKPCGKHGKCKNDPTDLSKFKCTCDDGFVGLKCEKKDGCRSGKKKCPHGKCELDAKFNPVCKCEPGFKGSKCDKRNCTIEKYKAKHMIAAGKSKIYMDNEKKTVDNLKALDGLLNLCKCTLRVTQSFTKLVKPTDMVKNEYTGIIVGRALRFDALMDKKGKKVACDAACLSPRFKTHTNTVAKCFFNGLDAIGWKKSLNGLIIETNMEKFKSFGHGFSDYNKLKELKQVGCQQDKHFPVFKTRDHLLVDYNPNGGKKCPVGLAGPLCKQDDKCVKKNPCKAGSVCTLDAKLNPVCKCKNGYGGSKCNKKICTIKEFKGSKGYGGHWYKHTKFYVSEDQKKTFEELGKLAYKCKVQFGEVKGFIKNNDPKYKINEDAPQIAGYGFDAILKDDKGKLLCNQLCLGKKPTLDKVKCLMSAIGSVGVGHNHKHPGKFYIKSLLLLTGAEYNNLKESKQVGCSNESWYKKM